MVPVEKSFVNKMFSVRDKVALVTGATGALGCVLAKAYGYAGAKVFMTGRNNKKLQALEDEFRAEGIDCACAAADPAKEEDVQILIETVVAKYGAIDILAVAHGFKSPRTFWSSPLPTGSISWTLTVRASTSSPSTSLTRWSSSTRPTTRSAARWSS